MRKDTMDMYGRIREFYDFMESHRLTPQQISLWYALLHSNNKERWRESFAVVSSVLCLRSGLDRQALLRVRASLKNMGLIDFEEQGNRPARYRLLCAGAEAAPEEKEHDGPSPSPRAAMPDAQGAPQAQEGQTVAEADADAPEAFSNCEDAAGPIPLPVDSEATAVQSGEAAFAGEEGDQPRGGLFSGCEGSPQVRGPEIAPTGARSAAAEAAAGSLSADTANHTAKHTANDTATRTAKHTANDTANRTANRTADRTANDTAIYINTKTKTETKTKTKKREGDGCAHPGRAPVFTPPTEEEVAAYCRERGNRVDALKWRDYYASKGWVVGRSPMRDWRASVRSWERNAFSAPRPNPAPQRYQSPEEVGWFG